MGLFSLKKNVRKDDGSSGTVDALSFRGTANLPDNHDTSVVDGGISAEDAKHIYEMIGELSRRVDMIASKMDDVAHKVSDLEFEVGMIASHSHVDKGPFNSNIDDVFSKIDELDRRNQEKRKVPTF